jgi:hypothetical protein
MSRDNVLELDEGPSAVWEGTTGSCHGKGRDVTTDRVLMEHKATFRDGEIYCMTIHFILIIQY